MPMIKLKPATINDLDNILRLFRQTIETINSKDYAAEQIAVWKNGASKKEMWLTKISQQFFLVAEVNAEIVGFASITAEGYLHFMYVSKDHQRTGVAQKLYDELEIFAKA